jgi:hypothetical protein
MTVKSSRSIFMSRVRETVLVSVGTGPHRLGGHVRKLNSAIVAIAQNCAVSPTTSGGPVTLIDFTVPDAGVAAKGVLGDEVEPHAAANNTVRPRTVPSHFRMPPPASNRRTHCSGNAEAIGRDPPVLRVKYARESPFQRKATPAPSVRGKHLPYVRKALLMVDAIAAL